MFSACFFCNNFLLHFCSEKSIWDIEKKKTFHLTSFTNKIKTHSSYSKKKQAYPFIHYYFIFFISRFSDLLNQLSGTYMLSYLTAFQDWQCLSVFIIVDSTNARESERRFIIIFSTTWIHIRSYMPFRFSVWWLFFRTHLQNKKSL